MTANEQRRQIESVLMRATTYLIKGGYGRHVCKVLPLAGIVSAGLLKLKLEAVGGVHKINTRVRRLVQITVGGEQFTLHFDHRVPLGRPSLHRGGIVIRRGAGRRGEVLAEIYDLETAAAFANNPWRCLGLSNR